MGRETTNIETQKGHAMPETRRRPAQANYRVTHLPTGVYVDVIALDGRQARQRAAVQLGVAEDDELEVRALPLTEPETTGPRCDAELVMAALDTGDWHLRKMLPSTYLTEEANREHAWMVERQTSPYCAVYGPKDPRGMYGPRSWSGPTALEALQKASDDLGIPLIAPPAKVPA